MAIPLPHFAIKPHFSGLSTLSSKNFRTSPSDSSPPMLGDTCKESKYPSVTKTFSVGFNHDISSKRIKQFDWQIKFWIQNSTTRLFNYLKSLKELLFPWKPIHMQKISIITQFRLTYCRFILGITFGIHLSAWPHPFEWNEWNRFTSVFLTTCKK